ncbi:MAG: 3-isopropylmalate/(R)-2-methylmalate dehydratase small subunit [Rhodospirillaceae bacterium]|nr:MAG: 3-isopropylmalate/(R)-2-methylmalate dehydratase small subunit [Rhodospirillaceae bacterium]
MSVPFDWAFPFIFEGAIHHGSMACGMGLANAFALIGRKGVLPAREYFREGKEGYPRSKYARKIRGKGASLVQRWWTVGDFPKHPSFPPPGEGSWKCPVGKGEMSGMMETGAMQKFTVLTGVAAPLPMINVDTDMIIPKQFLKTIRRSGLGRNLFHELRYNQNGQEQPAFVLNRPAYRQASILVTGANFGCGSSREHAPWAILDFGIRCLVAPSYADIFFNNCFKNGILPIVLPQEHVDRLMDEADRGANAVMTVDLERQGIQTSEGVIVPFEVDPFRKRCLLEGLDDIGLTMARADKIASYEERQSHALPWL